jgi:soluble lytic murein transglycosylase-like protein
MSNPTVSYFIAFFIACFSAGCSTPEPKKANVKIVEPLGVMIDRISESHNIPPTLGRALVEVESAFNANALSSTNAVGLTQVLRSTAKGECGITKLKHLANEETNLNCGLSYLAKLKANHGTWYRALIAYNIGGKWVNKPSLGAKQYAMRILRKAQI